MPPPRPCWPTQPLLYLREVGYPPHQAGLALWKDWRDSCLCSELIPSVTERSTLFVKELSFPQTAPTDDAFFQLELGWSVLESLGRNWNCRWAGPLALDVGLLCKNKKEGGSAGASPAAAPMPKSVPP